MNKDDKPSCRICGDDMIFDIYSSNYVCEICDKLIESSVGGSLK